ncbi:MAG: hypothetical protein AAGA93_07080 [Actinomycetota bacterium]
MVQRRRQRAIGRVVTLAAAAALLVAACSEDEPQDFTADNRTGFLAACTQPLDDSRTISAVCQCVFDETQAQLTFERFRSIDDELIAQADDEEIDDPSLPDDLAEIIAGCLIAEADL